MKNNIIKSLFVFAAICLFCSCEDDKNLSKNDFDVKYDLSKVPVVTMKDLATQFGIQVEANIQVTNSNGLDVMQQGLLISQKKDSLTLGAASSRVVASGNDATAKFVYCDTLSANTVYYARAFAVNKEGVSYSEIKDVKTGVAWDRVPVFAENFTTDSYTKSLTTFQFGTKANRGWVDLETVGNFYDPKETNPFGVANFLYLSESKSILDKIGAISDADNLLTFVADFTDAAKARVSIKAMSFAAAPIVASLSNYDSYQIIVSAVPITSKAIADQAKVLSTIKLSASSNGKEITVPLSGFDGKKAYLGIRHKYETTGYCLLIYGVKATAIYAPVS